MHRIFRTAPVLLHIIDHLDVAALLSLRLVNSSISGLISTYESSIVKSIAQRLYPEDTHDTLTDRQPNNTSSGLHYLVQLNYAHNLAQKAVASSHLPRIDDASFTPPFEGIAPDDSLGDEIRQKVQRGLMVIAALSRIHKQVSRNPLKPNRQRFGLGRLSRVPTAAQKATEKELLRRWLDHMNGLPTEDVLDYSIAFWCLKGKITFDLQGVEVHAALWKKVSEREAILWTVHHVASKGLSFIDALWSADPAIAQQARAEIFGDIEQKSLRLVSFEGETFHQFRRGCRREHHQPPQAVYLNTNSEADCYCESTFACRIGPSHNDMSPDQLHLLRYDATVQSMMRAGWVRNYTAR